MSNAGQRFDDVVISGLAHVDAPHVVTSESIEEQLAPAMQRLGVRPGLLTGLVGIHERRFWDEGVQPSEVAADAGELALQRSGVGKAAIGVLINTSVSRDYIEPSTASIIHGRMQLPPEAINFDLGNACLGFINGMNLVAGMIERGEIEHGLVVNGEGSRFAVESTIARLQRTENPKVFREQFATLTLSTAVELTAAALKQMQVSGGVDEQAVALRDAMRVLFPEAVALVSAARQGFMHER